MTTLNAPQPAPTSDDAGPEVTYEIHVHIQTFGEHICMPFVNHKRPDGTVCPYMANDVCNKCGWIEPL